MAKAIRLLIVLLMTFSALAAFSPARRLTELLPISFLASLTPSAVEQLSHVLAIYVPFMRTPIAEHFHYPPLVIYGPEASKHFGLEHEAMHAVDPCSNDGVCQHAFADLVPAEVLYSAAELYGLKRWSDGEAWAMIPLLYEWDFEALPPEVHAAYSAVLR